MRGWEARMRRWLRKRLRLLLVLMLQLGNRQRRDYPSTDTHRFLPIFVDRTNLSRGRGSGGNAPFCAFFSLHSHVNLSLIHI